MKYILTADQSRRSSAAILNLSSLVSTAMDKDNLTGKASEGMKEIFCLDGRLKIKRIEQNLIEETRAEESQAQNVFQNPLIFHHVLSYLNNLKDLKNCRLVHSIWTAEASHFLKKKSIIKISKEFLKTLKEDLFSLELFQPQNLLLFSRLNRYQIQQPAAYSNNDWGLVKEQMKKLSDGVKSLKFLKTDVTLPGPQSFTEILNFNFPNLVQLILPDLNFSWPNPPPPPIPSLKRIDWILNSKPSENLRAAKLVLLEGVLKLAPNLETLKQAEERIICYVDHINRRRPPQGQGVNIVLEHFIGNPSSCPNLKTLYLDDLSPLDIEALSNLTIKLRSLKLSNLSETNDCKNLQDFLKRQNRTLERLQLGVPKYSWCQTTNLIFPCLPNLKKLKIVHEKPAFDINIEEVDYAKQFPALQSLVIKCIRTNNIRLDVKDRIWLKYPFYGAFLPLYGEDSDRQVCKTLRVLKLPYPNEPELQLKDYDLFGFRERLSIMFPNVQNRFQKDFSSTNWGRVIKETKILSNAVQYLKFPYTKEERDDDFFEPPTKSFAEVLHYNLPSLVHLDLRDSDFSWPEPPPPPIHSLKRIDWFMNCSPPREDRSANLILITGVFELAPNLESLNLRMDRWETGGIDWDKYGYDYSPSYRWSYREPPAVAGVNIFLDHFNRNPSSCPNLKDLTFDNLSPLDIDVLSNLSIKLRSLKLSSLPMMADYKTLHEFLKRQNGTLEKLRLAFPTAPHKEEVVPHFTFPSLPKLKKLKLVHNSPSFRMTFEDVDYANMFPILQSLVIKHVRRDDTRNNIWSTCDTLQAFLPLYPQFLDKQVCKTLRVLKLPYPKHPEFPDDFFLFGIRERLSIMFPNVHNEHLDIGRARLAEGHPYLPVEPVPVGRCTRSKKPALPEKWTKQ